MTTSSRVSASSVRARIGHPIIDSDGHCYEFEPAFIDALERVGGKRLAERYRTTGFGANLPESPVWASKLEDRMAARTACAPWWPLPTRSTDDWATISLPKLRHERMPELGIDFMVVYPSLGLFPVHMHDEEGRRAYCRALNDLSAEIYRDYADRMTPAAIIPMHTPEEAIAELEHAVSLGLKVMMVAGSVKRFYTEVLTKVPEASRHAYWLDAFGPDSLHDYDPFWSRCVELQVAPTFHSGGMGWGSRVSTTNFMFNQIGHFAAAGDAVCKSLFMAGVTRRFPTLKFAFLEGGVGWACALYSDMLAHWKKRNSASVRNYDPANLDSARFAELFRKYGGRLGEGRPADAGTRLLENYQRRQTPPPSLDDWSRCGIERPEDIRDLFVRNFYFGCEADDPINSWAFASRVNPFGVRLKAIFGSDIGHWDVVDMREVVPELYEPVEEGLLTAEDLRDFAFASPVSLWAGMNRDFFRGTAIEREVELELAKTAVSNASG